MLVRERRPVFHAVRSRVAFTIEYPRLIAEQGAAELTQTVRDGDFLVFEDGRIAVYRPDEFDRLFEIVAPDGTEEKARGSF